ncbi:hypothetical protein GCM10011494_03690 [Novosphingobium endophyticum]|uniref:ATP-binding protein n=1 Tax=Novosphingobium endophyticum TaxID=1955250 RepID=A0A916X4H2_9SPHN|nr:hypothetical protein GCM10011494_03690 [Novosphingobium endophyticum]
MHEPELDPLHWLDGAGDEELERFVRTLAPSEQREWRWTWPIWARPSQIAPSGDWRIWLIVAGRGFGKTRSGAEWVNMVAEENPEARIALVAANLAEARSVMVEGESGLLSIGAPWRRPAFEPSLRRLTWPNGAQALLYSAGEADSLRGPQHSHARRTGAEGSLRQRSPGARRCAAALHYRRRKRRPSRRAGRRGDLAGGNRSCRRMGRT